MTSAVLVRPRTHARRSIAVSLALTAVAGLVLVQLLGGGRVPAPSASADAGVAEYVGALDRLGKEGGEVVAEGMKPGLADIAQQRYPDEVLVRMATGWATAMRNVQRRMNALAVPPSLAAVAVRFERSVAVYVHTAEVLMGAAFARGDERAALVDHAAALGHAADRLYDDAIAALGEAIE